MKGEKPPVPTRGLSKRSAVEADVEDADDLDEDAAAGDGARAAIDLVPRTDIRFAVIALNIIFTLKLSPAY